MHSRSTWQTRIVNCNLTQQQFSGGKTIAPTQFANNNQAQSHSSLSAHRFQQQHLTTIIRCSVSVQFIATINKVDHVYASRNKIYVQPNFFPDLKINLSFSIKEIIASILISCNFGIFTIFFSLKNL